MKDDGGTAFPVLERGGNGLELTSLGMSMRDYFACAAMEAMITKGMEDYNKRSAHGVGFIVEYAYEYADAMIKQRNK